jgi:Na+/H+ antiporter NhaC
MYRVEVLARQGKEHYQKVVAHPQEEIQPKEGKPQRAINALLPIAALITTVMLGLYHTGYGPDKSLQQIIGDADAYKALLWGSLVGMLVAAFLSLVQRILTLEETVDAWYRGMKSMLIAMVILILAWSLAEVTDALHTKDFLASLVSGRVAAEWLPALIFLLAAATAFATGSSWGAMGILIPLLIPLMWSVMHSQGLADNAHLYLMYVAIASILAGAVWGDHCSPISDTTILSSMASGCDHIQHVRTQIPYALYAGAVAVLFGIIPVSFGLPVGLVLLVSGIALAVGLFVFGKKVPDAPATENT